VPAARFVVPFGPGGAADRAARAVASALAGDALAPEIENVPGGGGLAGVQRANSLVEAAGDPVLLLATPSTHILLPARLGAQAGPAATFAPLLGLGSAPNVLLASPRLGVRTVAALVARAREGGLVFGSAGAGQTIHVCTTLFCEQAGIRMAHRSFDAGSAGAYPELAEGRIHVFFDNLLGCREAVSRGDAVALAVSAAARSALLPGVPTLAECGFPAHTLDVWFGVFGAGVDPAWRARLEAARADRGLGARLEALGLAGGLAGGEGLGSIIAASSGAWLAALRSAE
jgi:tripartite-type tricarboxylate transporter receptor subunit TctC